jgi:hypothetical protein
VAGDGITRCDATAAEAMGRRRRDCATASHEGGTGLCPVREELRITPRDLPPWQIGGATYFITFRTKGQGLLSEAWRG